jgi:catechol 2,3-dioxygenase-like lactoylglutathione lyase family enzyme
VLDHVGVPVSDFEQSKRFYAAALSPLGYELIMEPSVSAAGFGQSGKPDFWISQGEPGQAFHIAFAADDRATVDAFHLP